MTIQSQMTSRETWRGLLSRSKRACSSWCWRVCADRGRTIASARIRRFRRTLIELTYELRREDRMRKARGWLFGYKASKGQIAETRSAIKNPKYLSNLETMVQA